MILIYTPHITHRLSYIVHTILHERWGLSYNIMDDWECFRNSNETHKIVYSQGGSGEGFYIEASSLLFETNIKEQNISISWQDDLPLCFQTQSKESCLSFDVFAACFYFLSRYEEYLPYEPDEHGRFRVKSSWVYQNNVSHIALVDRWIACFAKALKTHYPDLELKERKFTFIPTYDVDVAYAYQNKGIGLTLGGYAKHLWQRDFQKIKQRTKVLTGKQNDPYDTFDYLTELHKKYGLTPLYFILFADRSRYDKNNFIHNKNFIRLINRLKENANIGIHASYASSFNKKELLKKEKQSLENVINQSIEASRQHYLRIRLPDSYDSLMANHILHDYSMGYVSCIGFRAGTCHPFLFFDLKKNKTTPLRVHSLLFMENAFLSLSDTTAESLWKYIKPYVDEVKKHKGELITLFHNQSFGKEKKHLNIKTLYEILIRYVLT